MLRTFLPRHLGHVAQPDSLQPIVLALEDRNMARERATWGPQRLSAADECSPHLQPIVLQLSSDGVVDGDAVLLQRTNEHQQQEFTSGIHCQKGL